MKRSRPGKAKGGKGGAGASSELTGEEARSLKALVDTTGSLSDADVLRVVKADKPCEGLYSKACKGKSGNPSCLCNLLPAPGGFRRQGLWAKQADVLGTLGRDPAETKRKDRSKPVGLKNLGNTCYVNSVLQCLFANAAFRRAVYALRQPLADEPILRELRQLFLGMEFGCCDPLDPADLAKALNLDHGEQQDGQEFMKLFLTLLEARFGGQSDLQGLIQDLFRGQSGYRTTCQACGRQSESSARSDNFYEVDVPVKGFRSLQDSLNSMLMPETMEGDNQYSCEYCGKKVDATRQLELRLLPPVLCFSLQRFVFDFTRMDRVKVSDKFAFPLTLDMAPILCQRPSPDLVFELEAIMVHKGGSATQGHYVAHIKQEGRPSGSASQQGGAAEAAAAEPAAAKPTAAKPAKKGGRKAAAGGAKAGPAAAGPAAAGAEAGEAGGSGEDGGSGSSWWRFDDDAVTELKGGPTASTDHGGAAKAGAAAESSGKKAGGRGRGGGRAGRGRGGRGGRGRGKRAAVVADSDEDYTPDGEGGGGGGGMDEEAQVAAAVAASLEQQQPPPADAPAAPEDAPAQPAAGPEAGAEAGGSEIVSSNAYLLVYRRRGADLPLVPLGEGQAAALAAAGAELAGEQEGKEAAYAKAKADLLERQRARQEEVRGIVEAAAALEEGDPGRFVSAEWLARWADAGPEAGEPEPVDNSPLLCPHGKLDPAKVAAAARRVSTAGWERLRAACRGGPELAPGDACPQCLSALLDGVVAREDTQGLKQHYLEVAAVLLAGEGEEQGLEPAFYVGAAWLGAWLRQRKGSMGGTPPTKDITCPCGGLAPEGSKTKRVAIPEDFWRFLQRSWQAACAERRARQRKKAAGAGGGGGGGAWEVAEEEPVKEEGRQLLKEEEEGQGGEPEVVVLESPTAAAAEQQPRQRRRQRQAGAGGGEASAAPEEAEEQPDVVMLDGDSDGGGGDSAAAAATPPQTAAAAPAADADALLEFAVGCPECATCAGNLREASNALKGLQGRLAEEKAELAHLLQAVPPPLAPGETYRLVPAAFMAQWRAYMQQAGKRALSPASKAAQIVQPPSLEDALLGVLCECHSGPSAQPAADGQRGGPAPGPEAASQGAEEAGGGGWMLGYAPPAVVSKRGRWMVVEGEGNGVAAAAAAAVAPPPPAGAAAAAAATDAGVYEVLLPRDWYALAAHYGPGSQQSDGAARKRQRRELGERLEALLERGIEATLVADGGEAGGGAAPDAAAPPPPGPAAANGRGGRVAALRAAAAAAGEDSGSDADLSTERDWVLGGGTNPYALQRRATERHGAVGTAHFVTDPQLCQLAVTRRAELLRAAALDYSNEEIVLQLVATAEEAMAAADAGGGAERKSKRARKGRAPVTVSSGDTLQQLRFHVLQCLDVHPRNAQLFLRGARVALGDDATLAECGVFPHDEIKVVDSGEHDASDLASLFPAYAPKGKRAREAERGFTGTALTGLAPAHAAPAEGGGGGDGREGGLDLDAELAAAAAAEEAEAGADEGL